MSTPRPTPRHERWRRLTRRLVSISLVSALWIAWLTLTPLWLPLFGAIDLVRRRGAIASRCGCMLAAYLTCEVVGLLLAGGLWLGRVAGLIGDEAWQDVHFRLEAAWGSALFRSMVAIFGLRIQVEGTEEARLGEGPFLLLLRHSSIADTLLASALVSRTNGTRLRYVLKKELLVDPCLDIVGHRLPNVFVDRGSDDSQYEIRRIEEIANELGPVDGVLIYPEGTRHTDAKRARLERRFEAKGDQAMSDYLRRLSGHVLPPRAGGTLGLLAAAPTADVVFCRHTGFEGVANLSDVWNGALLGREIKVRFDRVPRLEIPKEPDLQRRWLFDEWLRTGSWIDAHRLG